MSQHYEVSARKYRPHNFQELVGQTHTIRTLVNALDNNNLHHGFLFTGTRGVGKTTIARIFAKSVNCEEGVSSTPCGKCPTCLEIDKGQSVDLTTLCALPAPDGFALCARGLVGFTHLQSGALAGPRAHFCPLPMLVFARIYLNRPSLR